MKAFVMMFLLFVAVLATGTVSAAQEQAQTLQQVSLQNQPQQPLNIQDAAQTQQIQDCFQYQTQTPMKELTPGHRYELESASGQGNQILQFIEKAPDQNDPTQLILIQDGPQRDEALKALIASYQYLQKDYPCRENAITITKLEEALMWQQARTAARQRQQVEGKRQPHD